MMTAVVTKPSLNPGTTRRRFDQELDQIRGKLLLMAGITEEMLTRAIEAMLSQDAAMGETVIRRDEEVDNLDRQIESDALLLLATQQPVVGSDLRFLSAALKVITDLERIGDHAVNIAKSAQRMAAENIGYEPFMDLPKSLEIARRMLRDSLRAFTEHDPELAAQVIERDDEADILYREAQRDLRAAMQLSIVTGQNEDSARPVRASYLLFVAHYLERVCDHCTNIAEQVIFAETGEIVVPERGPSTWKS